MHTFYLESLFPVFMKRVKCHSEARNQSKQNGMLFSYATLMLVMQKESSIRVIDPTLSRLPSSWMCKRIALQQGIKKAKIIIRLFANEHIRVRTSEWERAHTESDSKFVNMSFIWNHLRWQNAFLSFERKLPFFAQWIAFIRKMLKYGCRLMMKNVITLYFYVVHFFCSCQRAPFNLNWNFIS